jgi:DNA-binding transcriptional LysR family regulator
VLRDSSLMARQLAAIESWVVAAPQYLERNGTPQSPGALAQHEALVYRTVGGRTTVRLDGPDGAHEIEWQGRLQADEVLFLRDAAVAGAGVAVLPTTVVRQAVASGRLVRVLPDYAVRRGAAWLVWPSNSHVPARVVALREFLAERLSVAFRAWVGA